VQDARATNLDLNCSSAIACEDKAVQIATAQIQRQAIGFSSQEKTKIGAKSEVPAVPCALKPLGLVRRPWPSAELFQLPIEHALN
jgi:hypothetical protein